MLFWSVPWRVPRAHIALARGPKAPRPPGLASSSDGLGIHATGPVPWGGVLIKQPFGGHHSGGDSYPPTTFKRTPAKTHGMAPASWIRNNVQVMIASCSIVRMSLGQPVSLTVAGVFEGAAWLIWVTVLLRLPVRGTCPCWP